MHAYIFGECEAGRFVHQLMALWFGLQVASERQGRLGMRNIGAPALSCETSSISTSIVLSSLYVSTTSLYSNYEGPLMTASSKPVGLGEMGHRELPEIP